MYQTDAQVCVCVQHFFVSALILLALAVRLKRRGVMERTECSVLLLLECVFLAKVIRAVIASVCVCVSLSLSLPDGG